MSLHLTRLRVAQVRQFRQPFELAGLEPGLNIFTGPNEAGKSTLVRAIRAAFFERCRSSAVEDLRPWGDSAAVPTIELDFTLGTTPYQVIKSFLGKKRCDVRAGTDTWDGTDAEDHLARLFGFDFATRGGSKAEHWGIPGLLWIEQGTGQELGDAAQYARTHLHEALQAHISQSAAGAMAATGGDALLAQLTAQRNELLTSTGRPKASYAEAGARVDELRATLQGLDTQIASYRQQVDQLAGMRSQHLQDEVERPWEAVNAALQAARDQQQVLTRSQQQLDEAGRRHAQLVQQRSLLVSQLEAFDREQADAVRRQQVSERAQAQLEQAEAALVQAAAHAEQLSAQSQAAREALRLARQEAQRQTLLQQVQDNRATLSHHQQALAQAEQAQHSLSVLKQQAASNVIEKADVDALRKLDRQLHEVSLRRQAVATRLQFTVLEGQTLTWQDASGSRALSGTGECLLTEPVTLALPGLGQLRLTPGGEEIEVLARTHAQVQESWQAALQRIGVADLAEAESRLVRRVEALGQIKLAEQALALMAPKGLDTLRDLVAQVGVAMTQAEAALASLPARSATVALPLPSAEAAQEAAEQTHDAARQALSLAQQQRAAADSGVQNARREQELAEALLADPARVQRQSVARQQLLDVGVERDALQAHITQLAAQLQAARPDIVQQDIQRLERSMAQMVQSHQQRHVQVQLLEQSLQLAGAQGLEEQREALQGELGRAEQRWQALRRRALALDWLCQKLESKRQDALARLQAPLQEHLQRYLQLLLPDAKLEVNEQLAPAQLWRRGAGGAMEAGDFESLSFGAREQLALISRFAYADLLREAGRPTLLILDDALVHADQGRLAQMKRVIFDAAQRHQVLLFTCHPEWWRDMGVPLRDLVR